jgi:hypothetical protein
MRLTLLSSLSILLILAGLSATPEQLTTTAIVLDEHCAANAVPFDAPEREEVARRLMFLFSVGVSDAKQFAALLTQSRVP